MESDEFHTMFPGGWLGATPKTGQHQVTEENPSPAASLPEPGGLPAAQLSLPRALSLCRAASLIRVLKVTGGVTDTGLYMKKGFSQLLNMPETRGKKPSWTLR